MPRICSPIAPILTLCGALLHGALQGQSTELYAPLAIPPAISGSFGELRSDHFHSGIDFRTGGKVGYRVYASGQGFVSRVRVSPVGFGKAIYVEHPNGLTTVYAHLHGFSSEIAQYVERAQYAQRKFEVDLFPARGEIPVEQGEVIALSGNSGSSGGPHLHYEVRHTASQVPMSPLGFFGSWRGIDTSAPRVRMAYLYQIDSVGYMLDSLHRTALRLLRNGNRYRVADTVLAHGRVAIGVEVFDLVNGGSSRCGFQRITQTVNNRVNYTLSLDSFAFAETKYVNSVIDYRAKMNDNREVVLLWADANNRFSGLRTDKSGGFIDVEVGKTYRIVIAVSDSHGNTSTAELTVKGMLPPSGNRPAESHGRGILMKSSVENSVSTADYDIVIPRGALYHDIIFRHSATPSEQYRRIYQVNSSAVPIHKRFLLRAKQLELIPGRSDKYFIGYLNGKGLEHCDTKLVRGELEASCAKFGRYAVAIDTTPPTITPTNIASGAKSNHEGTILFRLEDDTGISGYAGYIDNDWALFEWDPKTKTLLHQLNSSRTKKQAWHTLKLQVTDRLDNKSEFECRFFW